MTTPSFAFLRSVISISFVASGQMGLFVLFSFLLTATSFPLSKSTAYGSSCPTRLFVPSRSFACSTVNFAIPVMLSGGGSTVPSANFLP